MKDQENSALNVERGEKVKVNNRNLKIAIISILFIILNVIAFVIPIEKGNSFWITYGFTIIAFLSQIVVWRISFIGVESHKTKFLGIPLIYLTTVYLIIQIVLFAFIIVASNVPTWITIILNILVTGIFLMIILSTLIGRNEVDRIEVKVSEKVYYIKSLQAKIEMLALREKDPTQKQALDKLAQKVRFSDPMSHESLSELELEISQNVDQLKQVDDMLPRIEEIEYLLTERNKMCKLLK